MFVLEIEFVLRKQVDDHLACAVAGITADANILINYARLAAQRYTLTYQEPIPVEQLIINICDRKQGYTQFGGLRPFGVSFLWAGWDKNYGFQLYQSDPSGNYGGWKATAIGANNQAAQSILKQEYKNDMELGDVIKLAIKVLNKSMDSTSLTSEKCTPLSRSHFSFFLLSFRVICIAAYVCGGILEIGCHARLPRKFGKWAHLFILVLAPLCVGAEGSDSSGEGCDLSECRFHRLCLE